MREHYHLRCRGSKYNDGSKVDFTVNNDAFATKTDTKFRINELPLYFVVDGGWGDWGPWSLECPIDCLQGRKRMRTRTRTRLCSNPAPQGDGLDCEGKNTDSHICGRNKLTCGIVVIAKWNGCNC